MKKRSPQQFTEIMICLSTEQQKLYLYIRYTAQQLNPSNLFEHFGTYILCIDCLWHLVHLQQDLKSSN